MINNREDANKYYQLVNELVDDYIDKWKIRPSNLKRYLKPGSERFNKFLERNKLKDIKGAEKVLRDVIEDRHHMETDGVITFESFKMFESDEFKIHSLTQCLYKGIDKANNSMEKILADKYDTSLGQIDIVDSGRHIFRLNNWERDGINVVVFSKEEIEIIKHNIIDHLFIELTKKKINLIKNIEIDLSDLIKSSMFEGQMNQILNSDKLMKVITDCIFESDSLDGGVDGLPVYQGEFKDYHIWMEY